MYGELEASGGARLVPVGPELKPCQNTFSI